MLDLIIGPFLEYGPLGDLNKTSVDGKNEVWYNSKIDITFGDTTSWLIGLGRMTNISGPDLKVVADWSFIFELIPEPTNKALRWGKSLLLGAGGATDLILGGKDSLNYGHTQDTNIIRKNAAPLEIKIFKDKLKAGESLFPKALIALIVLPYLTLLTIVVTSRFAYMQVGAFSEKNLREQVRGALNLSAPLIESRWVACLHLYETYTYTSGELKKLTAKLKKDVDDAQETMENHSYKLAAEAKNILIVDPAILRAQIEDQTNLIQDHLSKTAKQTKDALEKASDTLKISVSLLGDPKREYKNTNTIIDTSCFALNYNVLDQIRLAATEELTSFLEITPDTINLSSAGTSFNFGQIGATKGIIDICFSDDRGRIKLGADGNSLSHMIIRKESLLIQSGKTKNENPTIELKEGSLKIRCGPALMGRQILFDNDKVTITAGDQTPLIGTGPKFIMTNDSIELTVGNGPAQSSLKISSAGIEIKAGPSASTQWSSTGINMKAAENQIEIGLADLKQQAIMLQQNTDAVAKIKSVLSNLDVSAIEKTNAALRNLK